MAIIDSEGNKDAISVHYPNDNLVSTIIRAWLDSGFRQDLLTYPNLTTQELWSSAPKTTDYQKPRARLAEMGVYVEHPIVLTPQQYEWDYTKSGCDVVYVLPDEPSLPSAKYSVDTARTAMKFCVFGM
jgi:hypothetical protein